MKPFRMTENRAIVVDQMAVLLYDHNVEALRLYETELENRVIEVVTLVSQHLPKEVEGAGKYHRVSPILRPGKLKRSEMR